MTPTGSKDRLNGQPQKGTGENPGWVEISWDEALDLVASKMKKMIEKDPGNLFTPLLIFKNL